LISLERETKEFLTTDLSGNSENLNRSD